jgi:hypothetical protein
LPEETTRRLRKIVEEAEKTLGISQ